MDRAVTERLDAPAMTPVGPNFICRPYRGVSVQEADVAFEYDALRAYLLDRPVYRRTEFIVFVRGNSRAVVQVGKRSTEPLFSPVTAVNVIGLPDDVAFIADERIDTGNATAMARAALDADASASVYVIEGRFQHVNLIVEPAPLVVRVVEVVPPEPPKLLEMVQQVVAFDEALPPVTLTFEPIDLRELAAGADAERFLFPCRCAGLDVGAPVDFLDACPPKQQPWTLVGCERSRQIHEAFYGADPDQRVELCPKLVDEPTDTMTLMKCCLLERGVEQDGGRAVVPWGANLEEVRAALRALVGVVADSTAAQA